MNQGDAEGMTALHFAARDGDHAICRLLLSNYADPNCLNNNYESPLHLAFRSGLSSAVDLLLSKGAASNMVDKNFETPLCHATRNAIETLDTRTVTLLIKAGSDICSGGTFQQYLLAPAGIGDREVVAELISRVSRFYFKVSV